MTQISASPVALAFNVPESGVGSLSQSPPLSVDTVACQVPASPQFVSVTVCGLSGVVCETGATAEEDDGGKESNVGLAWIHAFDGGAETVSVTCTVARLCAPEATVMVKVTVP